MPSSEEEPDYDSFEGHDNDDDNDDMYHEGHEEGGQGMGYSTEEHDSDHDMHDTHEEDEEEAFMHVDDAHQHHLFEHDGLNFLSLDEDDDPNAFNGFGEEDEDAQNAVWDRFFGSNLSPDVSASLLASTNRFPLMSRLYSMHAHSSDLARALVQIFGDTEDITVKTLACRYMHRLCLIRSKYLVIMYKEGLIPLLTTQLAHVEYVDLAEGAMPLIEELAKKYAGECKEFIAPLMTSVDFFNTTTQRIVYRILCMIGDNGVVPMMQEMVLHGSDKSMLDSAVRTLQGLGMTHLVRERILELAMDKDLIPSVKDALKTFTDIDPVVIVALIRNGHLGDAMELLQIKDLVKDTQSIEEELMHQVRHNPSMEHKKDVYDVLGKMFTRVKDNWRERASLIAALLTHGENVKKLADLIPDEYLLEQGISTDPGYPPKAVQEGDSTGVVRTEWQLVNKILLNKDPSMDGMETGELLGLCQRALFRYDTFVKLYQMHMTLDDLLPFARPVRLSARIVDEHQVTQFKAMTAVDLLMPAREVTNILLCKWRNERAAPRPPLIMSSYDDTDLIVGNQVDMLSSVIDDYELHFVLNEKQDRHFMRDIKVEAWQSLTFAALGSLDEPWRHAADLIDLITRYSLEVRRRGKGRGASFVVPEIEADQRARHRELFAVLDHMKSIYEMNSALDASLFVNARISSKLSIQLHEQMMIAVGEIPRYWHGMIACYPFLFDCAVKEKYVKALFMGTPRGMHFITDEGNAGSSSRLLRLHRAKLRVSREDIGQGVKALRGVPRDAVLEVEYVDEIGTGSGPTIEFYTLASRYLNECTDQLWTTSYAGGKYFRPDASREHATLLALLVERAMMEGRTLELELHDAFLLKLAGGEDSKVMQVLDPQLYALLTNRRDLLIGQPYELPGYPDIPLTPIPSSLITTANLDEYCRRVIALLVNNQAFEAFFSAFSFPAAQLFRLFTLQQLSALILPSPFVPLQWSQQVFLNSIKCDHGYTTDSAQIQWLANWISDLGQEGDGEGMRSALVRWITGASRLPRGRWDALDPRLTIVPKGAATASVTSELPSVMTCVNYLKVPRYSSEGKLRERMELAVREGGGSFHLS